VSVRLTLGVEDRASRPPRNHDRNAEDEFEQLRFGPDGLIPAIIQDANSGTVLCLGYMNRDTLSRTLEDGLVWFYSRSKGRPWLKGETSGNFLVVRAIGCDCDGDALLVWAKPLGPVCHTLTPSCFTGRLFYAGASGFGRGTLRSGTLTPSGTCGKPGEGEGDDGQKEPFPDGYWSVLTEVSRVINERRDALPRGSYVASMMRGGYNEILKKIGEEASEVVMAAKDVQADAKKGAGLRSVEPLNALASEVADLWFHTMILLSYAGLDVREVLEELYRRRRSKNDEAKTER
ncbi:MAG TPA: bifunctional phosphoribosyl-AMP cyclohydrolase/phosphoribosyl-ATP diphosphatase HisIE, partial [Clostridia bacterium]|nr:bifunctional phosphoribosyl-AMP cyclohydrolase/phosphoribosyl-ATP diphosphatase HisIE [Clostridia bacterium]